MRVRSLGSGRAPEEGNGNPRQYSQRNLAATAHRITQSGTQLSTHSCQLKGEFLSAEVGLLAGPTHGISHQDSRGGQRESRALWVPASATPAPTGLGRPQAPSAPALDKVPNCGRPQGALTWRSQRMSLSCDPGTFSLALPTSHSRLPGVRVARRVEGVFPVGLAGSGTWAPASVRSSRRRQRARAGGLGSAVPGRGHPDSCTRGAGRSQ